MYFNGKRIINLMLVFFSCLMIVPEFSFSQNITMEEAIGTALKNNEKIKQYQERVIQKEYLDKEAFGNFLPSISFQGSYNHLNDNMIIDLSPIRDAMIQIQSSNQVELTNIYNLLSQKPALTVQERAYVASQATAKLNSMLPAFEEIFKKQDFKSASLTAVQPIFLGGKLLAAKNYSSSERKSAGSELIKIQNEVVQETINNYLGVVLMDEIIKTRKEVISGMHKHKADAELLSKQGLIAPYQVLRAEVAVADAERNLFDDNNKRELALIALRHTIGISENQQISVQDSLFYTSIGDSLDTFITKALKSQPVLELIAEKKIGASQKYVAERAEFLPQVAGFGKYELYPSYLSSIEPKWVVGVQVSMNLFSGFKKWDRMQEAEHLEKEVQYLEDYTKKQIKLWVNKSYREMRNAQNRYLMLQVNINLSSENLRQNEKRFQTGLNTSLEVIDARLNLEKNQIERLNSLYDYYRSFTDLLVATGNVDQLTLIWNSRQTESKIWK